MLFKIDFFILSSIFCNGTIKITSDSHHHHHHHFVPFIFVEEIDFNIDTHTHTDMHICIYTSLTSSLIYLFQIMQIFSRNIINLPFALTKQALLNTCHVLFIYIPIRFLLISCLKASIISYSNYSNMDTPIRIRIRI